MDTTGIGTRAPAASRFLGVAAVVFAVIHLIDFTFYGQSPRNLAGALGCALIAYGTRRQIRVATLAGAVLALGAIVVKYVN